MLWGGSFFFGQVALAELCPFTVVLGRVGIAAVALWLIVALAGQRVSMSPRAWGRFFAMGAINNLIPFSLLLWSQTRITSSLASILNATAPLFVVLLAHFLTRDERMTVGRVGGVVAGLIGVAVMIGPEALRGLDEHLVAELAALGAPVAYALAAIYGRRFRKDPPLVTAAGQVTATTIMILPLALVLDRPWEIASLMPATVLAIGGLALLSTALAYVIFFRILATAGATNIILVTLLVPVSALVLGMSVLGERLTATQFAGMALIGLGLALIDGRLLTSLTGRLRGQTQLSQPKEPPRWNHR